jgi:hypothetical protein
MGVKLITIQTNRIINKIILIPIIIPTITLNLEGTLFLVIARKLYQQWEKASREKG